MTCKNLTCDSLWLLQKGKTKRISSDYRKKPQFPLPRQILGVADRVSWQGRRLCDLEEGVSELSTVFLSNLQLYFFQFVICILLTLSRVLVYVRRLERLVACWRRLIVVWIMWGPARSDNRVHGSFSRTYTRELEGAYSLLLYVSSQRYTQATQNVQESFALVFFLNIVST